MAIDFMKVFKGLNFAGLASAPSSPANGDVYYDTTLQKLRCYQNGAWVNLSDTDGTVLLSDGSVGSPSLAFADDTDTGIYSSSNGDLSITIDAGLNASFQASRIRLLAPLHLEDGSASAPSYTFNNDSDTGLYRGGSGITVIAGNSSDILIAGPTSVRSQQPYYGVVGSVSAPGYTFTSDTDTGLYNIAANRLGVAAGGTLALDIQAASIVIPGQLSTAGAGLDTSSLVRVGVNGSNPITASTGYGYRTKFFAPSTMTALGSGFYSELETAAASFTLAFGSNYNAAGVTSLGAGSTITRFANINLAESSSATNNALISDSTSFTAGNWAIILASTNPSRLSGQIQLPDGSSSTPSFSFSSQTSLGFYRSALDTITLVGEDETTLRIFNTGTNDSSILRLTNNGSSTGDQFIHMLEGGVTASEWVAGRDDSDSGAYKISQSSAPGTNDYFKLATTGRYDLRSAPGQDFVIFSETGNTTGTNRIYASLASGNTTGDAYYVAQIDSGSKWSWGLDNSDSDSFKLSPLDGLGVTDYLSVNLSGMFTIGQASGVQTHQINGSFTASHTSTSEVSYSFVNTDNTTGTSNSAIKANVGGASGGDPYIRFRITGVTDWSVGSDNSDSDKFKIVNASSLTTAEAFSITTAGIVTLGAVGGTQDHTINGNSVTLTRGSGLANIQMFTASSGVPSFYTFATDTAGAGIAADIRHRGNNNSAAPVSQVGILYQYGSTGTNRTLARVDVLNTNTTVTSSGGRYRIQTSTTGGTSTTALEINENQVVDMTTGGLRTKVSTANVSNPPTDAELDSAFGTPATVGSGFVAIVNDNNAGTDEYMVWSDGTNWFYATGTKAV